MTTLISEAGTGQIVQHTIDPETGLNRDQIRAYSPSHAIAFRKTKEKWGGLSNMAAGYPLVVAGIRLLTSEALYQCCRYPHLPEVQRMIIAQRSPMTAKMKSKRFRPQTRPHWERLRVACMRWCLQVKLLQHWDDFGRILVETGDRDIVEEGRKDPFWSARPQQDGTLVGYNVLGRLLMQLREQLRCDPHSLREIHPPAIPDFVLLERPIPAMRLEGRRVIDIPATLGNGALAPSATSNKTPRDPGNSDLFSILYRTRSGETG